MVHQDLPHQLRSHGEEMGPVLPIFAALIDESKVGLVDKCRGLQGIGVAFLSQVAGSKLAEFPVHKRCELIEGLLVAARPLNEKLRHVAGSAHDRALLDRTKIETRVRFEFRLSFQLRHATLYHCCRHASCIAQSLNPQINSLMNNCDAAPRRTGFRFSEIPEARADPVVGAPSGQTGTQLPRAASAERICGTASSPRKSAACPSQEPPFDKLASTSLREAEQRRSLTALPLAPLGKASKVEP